VKHQKILVVDDSIENLYLIENILQNEGHEIILKDNGFEALQIIDKDHPDLILLDVMMPKMDGFEVTRKIRDNPNLPFIPILLITAYDYPSVVMGLDSGADDFIRKPVEIEELLARVRSLLRLKKTVDERDQIARQQEDFVSRLTHDLRTPLVAADRMLMLMQQGALGDISPLMQEAIDTMTRSNRNLLEMVNTLLEVYRYEADRKIFNFSTVNLALLLEEVIQELLPLAIEKNLYFEIKVTDNNYEVEGDRLELRRVLTNLISNGIKFTDQGHIALTLERQNDWLVFSVKDTGVGISPEEQAILFQRFRQGSHRRFGSGLGLYLSRRIIEIHQGKLTLKSTLGEGSMFQVYLPLKMRC
jgi:two-component system, sensor histidine kinase and response regulator